MEIKYHYLYLRNINVRFFFFFWEHMMMYMVIELCIEEMEKIIYEKTIITTWYYRIKLYKHSFFPIEQKKCSHMYRSTYYINMMEIV